MAKTRRNARDEYPEDLEKEEQATLSQDDANEQPPSDIVAFNELRSCADLVRMYETKQLEIKPEFQRDIVWPATSQTRFIDSLTKQLPIPSMCIGLDYSTNNRIVIDGLQRIWSIIRFLTEPTWKLSQLEDIDERLSGRRVDYIRKHSSDVIGRVQNLTIPITVLRCNFSKPNHMEFLFTIFHRLNTGGNKLTNQEIRNCIYSGEFNDLLRDLASRDDFRDVFGLKANQGYRFAYEEFVLRVLAFTDEFDAYDGKLSRFLNSYMNTTRRKATEETLRKKEELFTRTVDVVFNQITSGAALPDVSKAVHEALFVGIARNIDYVESLSRLEVKGLYSTLRKADEFSIENLKNAITTKPKLIARLRRAVAIFSQP